MITPDETQALQFDVGTHPTQTWIFANGKPLPIVIDFAVRCGFTHEPTVSMTCRMQSAFTVKGLLAVTYIGPVGQDDHNTKEKYRVNLDFDMPNNTCYLDGELFPFTRATFRSSVTDAHRISIQHFHRPFPQDGQPETWVLRGFLVPNFERPE